MSRRAVLAVAGGLALVPRTVLARDGAMHFSAPPWSSYHSMERRQTEATRQLMPPEIPAPGTWREDMDHAHLAGLATAASLLDRPEDDPARQFVLTPGGLAALLSANSFAPVVSRDRMDETVVLFALRGCTVADPTQVGRPLEAVELTVSGLDYLTPRCVLGVWRRTEERIAVFAGSTVPNRHALGLQAAAFARGEGRGQVWRIANVLPTGRHEYTVGSHGGWQPAALRSADLAGRATIQPAMRSSSGSLAWRDLTLDPGVVLDNLHPALAPASDRYGAEFSSEGCLTLAEREPPARWSARPPDWQAFSTLGDLTPRPRRARRIHSLALLTGAEAWLAAQGEAAVRLRYGSRGPAVTALRETLRLPGGAVFDMPVLQRWLASGAAGPVAFAVDDPPGEAVVSLTS